MQNLDTRGDVGGLATFARNGTERALYTPIVAAGFSIREAFHIAAFADLHSRLVADVMAQAAVMRDRGQVIAIITLR